MLSDDVRRAVARRSPGRRGDARRSRRCATPGRTSTSSTAYEIQLLNIRRRLAAGATRRTATRSGLSSKAMQEMMGVDEPDYGHLLSDMEVCHERRRSRRDRYCYPRVEVEVAFVLGDDPAGRGLHRGRRPARPPSTSRRRSSSSTAGSPTGRSGSPTPSPTTPRRPASCSVAERVRPDGRRPRADRRECCYHQRRGRSPSGGSDAVLGNPVDAPSPGWPARSPRFGVHARGGPRDPARRAAPAPSTFAPGDEFGADFAGSAPSACTFELGGDTHDQADRRHRRLRQHRHRPDVQAAAQRACIEPRWMIGVDPEQRGPRARRATRGWWPAHEGVDWLLKQDELPDLIFEATSAPTSTASTRRATREAGIRAVDLTPAAVGPAVIPPVNGDEHVERRQRQHDHLRRPGDDPDGGGGLAGHAGVVRRDRRLGRRRCPPARAPAQNIDEFTRTTARGRRDDRRRRAAARRSSSSTRPSRR